MLSLKKLIFFAAALSFGCKYQNDAALKKDYKLIKGTERCYKAVCQKDSAFLKLKTTPDGKVHGKLTIKYGEPEPLALESEYYHGEITGKFAKDTLFADYTFTDGKHKVVYSNPLALLTKGNKLVLGYGVTINYLGRTWFRDHRAINFSNSRFKFEPMECVN